MGSGRVAVRDALGDTLMRPGGVVMLLILGQDPAQMPLAENQDPVRSSRRSVPMRRSQVAFIRGAWMAVRKIVVPAD